MIDKFFDGIDNERSKVCGICLQTLPISKFGKDGGANYLRYECKDCARKQSKLLRELKKTAPPISSDYVCPICELNEEQIKQKYPNKKNVWCCDHDHVTNKFRGWLCHKCNLALGNMNDDVKRLQNSINYLTKT